MSFFPSDSNKTNFEMGGGNLEPLPEGTTVLAMADEAKWDEYQGDSYISIRWSVLKPDQHKNRKIFQKLKVLESDQKKAEKARRMLAAIDMNASGGRLIATGEKPTDQAMAQHLCLKPMYIKLGVWDMNDKRGNWVMAVAPRDAAASTPAPAPAAPKSAAYDDSIDIDF